LINGTQSEVKVPVQDMLSMVPNKTQIERQRVIRFSDCDPAGIVFYPQYFVMFNGLVEDWFTSELKVNYYDLIGNRKVGLPTIRLEADFKNISKMGEIVNLQLAVARLGRSSIALKIFCVGPDGQLRMSVDQYIVTTSLHTHKAIEVPSDIRSAIMKIGTLSD